MNMTLVMAVLALAGAVLLLIQTSDRIGPTLAVVAAGLHLLIVTGLVRLSVAGISLSLVLGVALAVAGVMCWLKVGAKLHVSAATLILLMGVMMALGALPRSR